MRLLIALAVLSALSALAACGPQGPTRAASDRVVEGSANPGAVWPLLLQHCLRSTRCDPSSDFGKGAEQASGLVSAMTWFAETAKRVAEGPEDYGASILLTVYGTRGVGGPAGRPLTIDELPDTLEGANAKRSRLAIEYRTPGGGAPEPYGLWFESAWMQIPAPVMDEVMLEITGKSGMLLLEPAGMMEAEEEGRKATPKKIDPVKYVFPRNIRDKRVDALMAALMAGETLSLKLRASDGSLLLSDALYAVGYESALQQATASLADPEISRTIEERCQRFADRKDEFWKIADVTPALLVCDPRTPEQRR